MGLRIILKNKVRKRVVVFLGLMVIVILWYIEKTKLIPQYGKVFYEMGLRCEDECGQNKQLQYFQKAAHHNPEINSARYRLGLIYEEMEDYTKALKFFIKETELDQNNMLAYYKVGRHYFREGAYEQALRYFLRVFKGGGFPSDVRYYIARIYDQKKEYDLAINFYSAMVKVDNEYADKVCPRLAQLSHFQNRGNPAVLYCVTDDEQR